jgi:hypothetical protein
MISLAQAARDMGATRSVETSGEEPMNDNKNFADKATRAARETFEKGSAATQQSPGDPQETFLRLTSTSD